MDAAVDHIWQSTIVVLAASALTMAFRRNSATVRYWIWFAAAMKFLVPFAALAASRERLAVARGAASRKRRARCGHGDIPFVGHSRGAARSPRRSSSSSG